VQCFPSIGSAQKSLTLGWDKVAGQWLLSIHWAVPHQELKTLENIALWSVKTCVACARLKAAKFAKSRSWLFWVFLAPIARKSWGQTPDLADFLASVTSCWRFPESDFTAAEQDDCGRTGAQL